MPPAIETMLGANVFVGATPEYELTGAEALPIQPLAVGVNSFAEPADA